jgi:hypothetical protein
VLRAFKDLQVQLVNRVPKVFKVLLDRKEFKGFKGFKVPKEFKVSPDQQALRVFKDRQDPPA